MTAKKKQTKRRSRTRVVPQEPRLKAWSFSRLKKYEDCPRAAYFSFLNPETKALAKADMDSSKPMARGSQVHETGELYLKAKRKQKVETFVEHVTPHPTFGVVVKGGEWEYFVDDLAELRRLKAVAEQELAFTSWWAQTGWFDHDCWLRVKADATVVTLKNRHMLIIDFKTGIPRGWHEQQLDLYALAGFMSEESVDTVTAELWYTDVEPSDTTDNILSYDYGREQVTDMQEVWAERSRPMLEDTEFRATPSRDACRWCPFSVKKGGPCEDGV